MLGIHHVVLFCSDTDASLAWYVQAGFKVARSYGGMHWLRVGSSELMLHPAETPSPGDTVVHVEVEDVDRHLKDLGEDYYPHAHQEPGVRLRAPVTQPWGDIEFQVVDPDGHVIVFTQRPA